jgi:membrane-bound metal-dependent hydrolase YbcI (DUF457 family)
VDIGTHSLASFALVRGFFPGRRWPTVVGIIVAGTLADVDLLTLFLGPGVYFASRRTFTHSLLGTILVILLSVLVVRYLERKRQPKFLPDLLPPLGAAAVLHVLLDALQSEGVALLWPFLPRRYAADYLPDIDLWILALLIAGILVPELLRMVTSEMGVKDKRPRGRNGALVALVFIAGYIGARALFHSGSVALLGPHSYRGESPRRVGSFPDALSPITWHGVVETQSFMCLVEVPAGPGRSFDPESADCLHKPEASPELDAAEKSDVARAFVRMMPFPRAIVARREDGYEVVIRSMRDVAEHETGHRLAARILVDSRFGLSSEELTWVNDSHIR